MGARKFYWGLGIVFILSVAVVTLFPVPKVIRSLAAVPAVATLFVAFLQLVRERIAHERSLLILELQNSFTMGATSHMASVAFDKHVAFAEAYVAEMFQILVVLFRNGPCREALDGAGTLLEIRKKWSLWITPSVEDDLEKFEAVLRKIGANARAAEFSLPEHGQIVKQMFEQFAEVLGKKLMGSSKWEEKEITDEVAVYTVIRRLRVVLDVENLTDLRSRLISQAIQHTKRD